jgi:hypothetical protein
MLATTYAIATIVALKPLETVLFNKVIIFGFTNSLNVIKLTKVVNKFLDV